MNETEFNNKSCKLLFFIAETIENADPEGKIDVDLNDGILNIKNHAGTYVINKHSAAMEIWLSSPVSGPAHFKNQNSRWINRNNIDLLKLLTHEFEIDFPEDS